MWDSATQTRTAYYEAKKCLEVPFGSAAYLVDLYSFTDEMLDTYSGPQKLDRLLRETRRVKTGSRRRGLTDEQAT